MENHPPHMQSKLSLTLTQPFLPFGLRVGM